MLEIEDRDLTPYIGHLADTRWGFLVTLWGQEVFAMTYSRDTYDYDSALNQLKTDFTKRLSTALDRGIW